MLIFEYLSLQLLSNLKRMDLSYSRRLKELPDLSTATNLYDLDLSYCSSLVKLPSSSGNTINLQSLDLSFCSKLVEIPPSIGNAVNIKKILSLTAQVLWRFLHLLLQSLVSHLLISVGAQVW